MAAIASAPPWNPEDDLLLKNAVEAGASLEALAKGAVRFSRKFTVRELRERWLSLLYDAEVSAQASARMSEFELSNPTVSTKPGRFGVSKGGGSVGAGSPAKRRVESVRKQYYEMRKRLCSFNTFDFGFIDEPNDTDENVNSGNDLLDGSYVVGHRVKNYFEFTANNSSLLDNRQKDLCLSTNGSVKDNNKHNIDGEKNLVRSGDGLVDFRNCSSAVEAGTSHVLPDVPLWKTMEDVMVPEMPIDVSLEVNCQEAEHKLICDEGDKRPSPGYNVDRAGFMLEERLPGEELNRTVAISGDDFGDISDSLLNFANENEPLAMDVDGENMNFNHYKSVLLTSPKDGLEKDVKSVCQPENLDPKAFPVVSEDVFNAERKISSDLLHSGESNHQHSICGSETNIPSIRLVPSPHSPELHYEMMVCTLNSEDPEIPCNDDVIQHGDLVPTFTNQEKIRQESIRLKNKQCRAEPSMGSLMVGHKTVPKRCANIPLVKPNPFDGTRVTSVSKLANNILADANQCRSKNTTPAFAANQVLKEEIMNGLSAPVTISGERTLLSKGLGSTNRDVLEPEANPSKLYQDESEEELDGAGDDIPYFSDIENMADSVGFQVQQIWANVVEHRLRIFPDLVENLVLSWAYLVEILGLEMVEILVLSWADLVEILGMR
ncbi:hypothetical protein L484_026797 [Morus notabilis]|uniref:Microspherule protein N-terminal domain-containing protein n=1 Tax=Morus notabilis TaxID=981085 RepID=W9T128_9ROSA|nr:hypothetical protein L484_026797 [Morus notabilis]